MLSITPSTPSPATLRASSGAGKVGFLRSGTGAAARTVAATLQEMHVSAAEFGGADEGEQIENAIAAADGRPVLIPADMAAGEPADFPLASLVFDWRQATTLAGRKVVWNGSDSNGRNMLNLIDDQVDPPLSHAAILGMHRPTGTLPSNRNGEGAQFGATSIGTINNTPTSYILSGVELGAVVASDGGKIPYVWGAHAYAQTTAAKTTNVGELVSMKVIRPSHNGAGTVDLMIGLDVEDPSGSASASYAMRVQGHTLHLGNFTLNRGGTAGGSSLLSGGAALYYYLDVGRTSADARIGVAGAANDFFSGTAQGDAFIGGLTAGKKTWLMSEGAGIAKFDTANFQLARPICPPQDNGNFQTAAAIYAGSGAPSNANGANGNFYFRSDGGAGSRLYFKSGGTWTGIL
jgi:hypothetical protein